MTTINFANASILINGTGGVGFQTYLTQSSTPSAPVSDTMRMFSNSSGQPAYILNDGFVRTFPSTVTANRVYTFPDASANIVLDSAPQSLTNKTITDPSNNVTAAALFTTTGTVFTSNSNPPIAGQVLIASGPNNAAWQDLNDNAALAASVSGDALTINLTQYDGASDPSFSSPSIVSFRNATITSGSINAIGVTFATSITIPSGATIGTPNSYNGYIYVYALNDSGTVVLAVSLTPFPLDALVSSTDISGGGSSASTLYSDGALTNVPIQYLGKIVAPQTVAGTWSTSPSEIYVRTSQDYAAGRLVQKQGDIETINSSGLPAALSLGAAGTMLSTTDGVTLAYNALSTSALITGNGLSTSLSSVINIFGTALSGSATISVNTSLSGDVYYNNLTINVGINLNTSGCRVFVSGTLTITGAIICNGNVGSNASGGTGTAGGAALTGVTLGGSGAGGAGGNDSGGSQNGVAGTGVTNSLGGSGGLGGHNGGVNTGGAGGVATAVTAANGGTNVVGSVFNAMIGRDLGGNIIQGGGGGGGGAGVTSSEGGAGGGSGGGVIIIFANKITGAGNITATGGAGGSGGTGGGGAGGGGGVAILYYHSSTWSGTVTAAGGAGGSGGGATGSVGTAFSQQI
jgi:hypothetical protein